jgi:hypothetical protein
MTHNAPYSAAVEAFNLRQENAKLRADLAKCEQAINHHISIEADYRKQISELMDTVDRLSSNPQPKTIEKDR